MVFCQSPIKPFLTRTLYAFRLPAFTASPGPQLTVTILQTLRLRLEKYEFESYCSHYPKATTLMLSCNLSVQPKSYKPNVAL
jgi:hypothetical protein